MAETGAPGHRQRIKERFLAGAGESRTDQALLELLLTYAIPQKDVQPLAQKLLEDFGSLSAVLAAPLESLCRIDGIKSSSGVLLKLVDWVRTYYSVATEPERGNREESSSRQLLLFSSLQSKRELWFPRKQAEEEAVRKALPRRGTELFGKAVLKEAIALLPDLPNTESIREIRMYLRENLHFSAEETRKRYANYIARRLFPKGYPDSALLSFAKTNRDGQTLRDVCFYRFLKAEPLEIKIVEDLLIPSIGIGRLNRSKIRDYLAERFPSSASIKDCAKAIVEALGAGGVAKIEKNKISFAYRDVPIDAFSFVLHSEFPEPGMYDISKLETNRTILAMLWNPARILPSLYELRNRGLISKVSEIDNLRQFTTRWSLNQVVERLVGRGNGA